MLRFLYLILIFLIVGLSFSDAAKPVKVFKPKQALHYDTATIQVRTFNGSALKSFSKQPEFIYNDSYVGESLWSRFWSWFWGGIKAFLARGNNSSIFISFIKYLIIFLGLGALTFLILRLAGVDALNIFRRKAVPAGLPYSESLENIHHIDFDADIEKATAQHNYRYAVRLLYLKCLKQLNDAGQIRWETSKTNNTYIHELTDDEQRIAFNLLTRQFEYIWYGEFTIDGDVFKKIDTLFHEFRTKAA